MQGQQPTPLSASFDEILCYGYGFKSWNRNISDWGINASALTSQTIYAISVPGKIGQRIRWLGLGVQTAASGTAPTGMFVSLASPTTSLTVSTNLTGTSYNALWSTTGIQLFPLTATYTLPYTGLYYILLLQNGAWSVTQPQFSRGASGITQTGIPIGNIPFGTAGTGQTTLPAANAAVTIVTTSGLNFGAVLV